MIGQGRPFRCSFLAVRSRGGMGGCALGRFGISRFVFAFIFLVFLGKSAALLADEAPYRIRLAWGGGESRTWQGTLHLSQGKFSAVEMLGLEADAPGSLLSETEDTLRVYPRTPRNYDGCDLTIEVKDIDQATLLVDLRSTAANSTPLEIPLAKVMKGFQQFDLDDKGNRLVVERTPGDRLPVLFERDSLVFAPGEKFEFQVAPRAGDLAAGASYQLDARILRARSSEEISHEGREFKIDDQGQFSPSGKFSLALPPQEGVYDLNLSLTVNRLTSVLLRGKPQAERKIQLVVLDPTKASDRGAANWEAVLEFDPANPRWWEKMTRLPTINKIPGLGQQTYGNDRPRTRQHLARTLVELPAGVWQAYPLTLAYPGVPHILEVEYPSDLPQTLQISILEPNAAGQVGPLGLDSGIDVSAPPPGQKGEMRRQRITFWPQTKSPLILLANRRDDAPAIYGKIRVLAGPLELPPAKLAPGTNPQRLLLATFDKPLFPENFSAPEVSDPATGRSLDDWLTFFLGGRRLIEFLQYSGYNGAVITVACEGGAIYPSQLLQATPQYDSGAFFESGQDPRRKDILELLFRLFDRAGMQLIPAVTFSTPLPELEAIRLRGGAEAIGLEPLGADGRTWLARNGARRGQGVYYNPLDQRVQEALRHVVAELAERYGHHSSFGGVSLHLGGDGFAAAPDETCSYDDATISHFVQDTGVDIPAAEEKRYVERSRSLHGEAAAAWQDWRAEKMATLYRNLEADVARQHAGARLYLNPCDTWNSRAWQQALRPTLPAHGNPTDALLRCGIDTNRLRTQPGIIIPRPQRIAPGLPATDSVYANWNRSAEIDALFAGLSQDAGQVAHDSAPLHLPSFAEKGPFGPDKTQALFIPQLVSAGPRSRQPLVHAVATLDARTFLSGGMLLALGQEDQTAAATVFRRLPNEPFRTVETSPDDPRAQAVVVRALQKGGKTYFYLTNDSPWPLVVALNFAATESFRLESYDAQRPGAIRRQGSRSIWTISLEPFDLIGGELTTEKVTIDNWQVTMPRETETWLRDRVREVRLRANALRTPSPQALLANPSFESAAREGEVPGWVSARGEGIAVAVQPDNGHDSPHSLRISSQTRGGKAPIVWVRSEPCTPPKTGRLSVIAWLRIVDPTRQPRLRLALEGKFEGKTLYRRANVGQAEDGGVVKPLTTEWAPYRFAVNDLPLTGLSDLRVGFDLMGAGEVWIDDVQLFDLWFEESERDELLKNIATADLQRNSGHIHDCGQFLESYWPQFLLRHVPLEPDEIAAPSAAPVSPTPTSVTAPAVKPNQPARSARAERRENRALALPRSASPGGPAEEPAAPPAKPGMFDRVKGWLPRNPFR